MRGDDGQGFCSRTGLDRLVAMGIQDGGDEMGNAFLILYHQNFFTDVHVIPPQKGAGGR